MRMVVAGWVAIALSFGTGAAIACQPCRSFISLEETIERADLIVVATGLTEAQQFESENSVVRVDSVLKGEAAAEISVQTWYGMCSYGLFLRKDQQAVVYLKKDGDRYRTVSDGCAERAGAVSGDSVTTSKGVMTLEAFKAGYIRG
jgi:hypothetical protein